MTEGASLLPLLVFSDTQLLLRDRLNRPQHPIQIREQFPRLHPHHTDAVLLHPRVACSIMIELLTLVRAPVDLNHETSSMAVEIRDVPPNR